MKHPIYIHVRLIIVMTESQRVAEWPPTMATHPYDINPFSDVVSSALVVVTVLSLSFILGLAT